MSRCRVAALLAVSMLPCSRVAAHEPRPSILLVSVDTLRADRLSTFGNPAPTSPALDRIASRSIVFDAAFSQSPKTATSHMSLFTSLYPAAHGVRNLDESHQALPLGIPTLASLLSQAGYSTLAFTSGGNVHGSLGFSRGFERYEEMREEEIEDGAEVIFEAAGAAAEAQQRADPARPFFLFVHTYQTHDPYQPPVRYRYLFEHPPYQGRIVADHAQLVADLRGGHDSWVSLSRAFWARVNPADPADRQHVIDLYDACIRYVDDQLGALVSRLERLDPPGGLIVVVLSDHGEEFQDHGAWQHNTVYQEVVRVPLVMRFPPGDGVRPRRIDTPVRLIDVMPTLLERVGIAPPRVMDGTSLLPLLRGKAEPRPVFSQWNGLLGFREGRWKLVRKGQLRSELYDLQSDPREQHDVSAAHPERLQALSDEALHIVSVGQAFHAHSSPAPEAQPDPRLLEQLKALGYVGGGSG